MVTRNPYLITTLIFAAILFVGRSFLNWGDLPSAFLLLFFFLVTIGIRLDEIVKKISVTNERLDRLLQLKKAELSAASPLGPVADLKPAGKALRSEKDGS